MSGLVFVTFFFLQKHGLKWLNIAFYKPYFFFGFSLHFLENRGGSDPSVKTVTLSLKNLVVLV